MSRALGGPSFQGAGGGSRIASDLSKPLPPRAIVLVLNSLDLEAQHHSVCPVPRALLAFRCGPLLNRHGTFIPVNRLVSHLVCSPRGPYVCRCWALHSGSTTMDAGRK